MCQKKDCMRQSSLLTHSVSWHKSLSFLRGQNLFRSNVSVEFSSHETLANLAQHFLLHRFVSQLVLLSVLVQSLHLLIESLLALLNTSGSLLNETLLILQHLVLLSASRITISRFLILFKRSFSLLFVDAAFPFASQIFTQSLSLTPGLIHFVLKFAHVPVESLIKHLTISLFLLVLQSLLGIELLIPVINELAPAPQALLHLLKVGLIYIRARRSLEIKLAILAALPVLFTNLLLQVVSILITLTLFVSESSFVLLSCTLVLQLHLLSEFVLLNVLLFHIAFSSLPDLIFPLLVVLHVLPLSVLEQFSLLSEIFLIGFLHEATV
mmetsp:Transcript_5469/g.20459  ORF Transcript_5469/g.20459 Transcript_5469/m.20459 type:complete len:325 (-) Transcript_5469:902-1876(-)